MSRKLAILVVIWGVFIVPLIVHGAEDGPLGGHIQIDYYYSELSQGYGHWEDYLLNYVLRADDKNQLSLEFSEQNHFDDKGALVGAAYTRIIDDWWYFNIHGASSSGGFFLPRKRIDLSLSKKWLARKSLISTFGYTYYDAKDAHHDNTYILDLVYYFPRDWIVTAAYKLNDSQPGSIVATRKLLAIIFGRNKERFLVFKVDDGTEAYQIIGFQDATAEFASTEYSFTWREWVTKNFGINGLVNHYTSKNYERNGLQLGLFYEF